MNEKCRGRCLHCGATALALMASAVYSGADSPATAPDGAELPPISLHVKNATDIQVAEALGKEIGMPLETRAVIHTDLYTLDGDKKPYWEVVESLNSQHPLFLGRTDYNRTVAPAIFSDKSHSYAIVGGFAVEARAFFDDRRQGKPLTLTTFTIPDPRLNVIEVGMPQVSLITDDGGNALWKSEAKQERSISDPMSSQWGQYVELVLPQKMNKRVVNVEGTGHFLMQLSEFRVEIADVGKQVGKSFQVGPRTITLRKFDEGVTADMQGHLDFEVTASRAPQGTSARVEYRLVDADGAMMWTSSSDGDDNAGMAGGPGKHPLKLIISVPDKTREVAVPFKIKDIPLP